MKDDKIKLEGEMRVNYYRALTRYTLAAQKNGIKITSLSEIVALQQEEIDIHVAKIKELEQKIEDLQK